MSGGASDERNERRPRTRVISKCSVAAQPASMEQRLRLSLGLGLLSAEEAEA